MVFLPPDDPLFNAYWKTYISKLGAESEQNVKDLSPSHSIERQSLPRFSHTLYNPAHASFFSSIKQKLGVDLRGADNALKENIRHTNQLFQLSLPPTRLHSTTFDTMYTISRKMQQAQEIRYSQVSRRVKLLWLMILGGSLITVGRRFAPLHALQVEKPLMVFITVISLITWVYHNYQKKTLYEVYRQTFLEASDLLCHSPRLFSLTEQAIDSPAI
ncbi:hypothetical protein [Rhabdochlamydiaceae symbiont of Dictyostelium giganteum]|uniref:hypothetical protein n=1 Tax=Rhabdochlamydiaceae symbiont of Dictyostelium giganteum TaxID=3342349 RepID=UPI00384F71D0